MPTTSHRQLTRALKATITFAVLTALVVVALPGHAHPPERVTVAADAPTVPYTGPTSDPHELERAIGRAQLAAFYEWQSTHPPPAPSPKSQSARMMRARGPAPEPSGDALSAIAAHFPDVYDQAVGVARCESTLDPGAVSPGGGNWGLFQINTVHRKRVEAMGYSWSQILDANVNAAVARAIYDEQGWGPWSCRWAARG